ncbi:MAG: hypothetical protein AAB074_18195 [Planctomycetota bacterium]
MAATAVVLCVLSARNADKIDLWMRGAPPLSSRSMSSATAHDLAIAMKSYETEFGVFPVSGNASLVRSLSAANPGMARSLFPPERLNRRGEWLDPRNRPYIYERLKTGAYRLYSMGPNGIDDGGKGDDTVLTN